MTLNRMVLVLLCWVSLMLNAIVLNVANKPFMVSVIMLNVVMLSVIMLNVVAPRPGACTIKHYESIIYRLCSKLACLYKLGYLWLTKGKTLAYYKICLFFINYESVKFYRTGPQEPTVEWSTFQELNRVPDSIGKCQVLPAYGRLARKIYHGKTL